MKKPKPPVVLRCANGTAWLDHFKPPIGTGLGCLWCAAGTS